MFKMTEKIEECFKHIAQNWKEESYKKCFQEWKKIELFIAKYPSLGYECSCGTKWTDLKFINKIDNICPACDVSCQPFLSNPKNREAVIQYIPKKYHKYIFTDFKYLKELFHQYDDKDDFFREFGNIDLGDFCIIHKEEGEYGTWIQIYSTEMNCKIYALRYNNKGEISTFIKYRNKGGWKKALGIYEMIYITYTTDFYINGKYYSTGFDDAGYIPKTIEKITHSIMVQKVVPALYDFIKGEEDFDLILLEDLDECEKIVEDINVSLIPCKQEKQNEMDIVKKVKEEAKTLTPVRVGVPDLTKQKIQLLRDIDYYRRQGYVDGRNYSMESSLEDLLMGYSRLKKRCEEDEVKFQQELISLLDKELISQQDKTEKEVKEEENSAKVREEEVDENKCDKCNKECNPENRCDFCKEKYCDGCLPFNIYMASCDTCKTQWCIRRDEYCEKNTRRGGQFRECGH